MERIELSADFMKEFHAEHPEFNDMDMSGWCECESESDPVFHNDHVTPMDNCVEKHHYHFIKKFFIPWGIKLNGKVEWEGEESGDLGLIVVKDNEVSVKEGRVVYE